MKSRTDLSTKTISASSFARTLIYHTNKLTELRKLCISNSCIEDIMKIAHDNDHSEFFKCFEIISQAWYVRNLIKVLRQYINHCFECLILQIRRHKLWKSLQLIDSFSMSFHIITIDFILAMSLFIEHYNVIMFTIDKFTKRITLISKKNTYNAKNWVVVLIERLKIADWDYPKIIISDRNRKFLFELWKTIFVKLDVHLLYSTFYHSQTNDFSERTNQIAEIALRFYIHDLKNTALWSECLSIFQALANNSTFVATEKTSNEIVYDFTSNVFINLLKFRTDILDLSKIRIETRNAVSWANMNYKRHYDR